MRMRTPRVIQGRLASTSLVRSRPVRRRGAECVLPPYGRHNGQTNQLPGARITLIRVGYVSIAPQLPSSEGRNDLEEGSDVRRVRSSPARIRALALAAGGVE
jgi:hypothetical protein